MKKLILCLVSLLLLASICTSAMAVTVYCNSCKKNVVGTNARCSGSHTYYSSWKSCDRGDGCLNYRYNMYATAYSCPTHTTARILMNSHSHSTDHEVSSHNRTVCSYY